VQPHKFCSSWHFMAFVAKVFVFPFLGNWHFGLLVSTFMTFLYVLLVILLVCFFHFHSSVGFLFWRGKLEVLCFPKKVKTIWLDFN